MIPKLTAAGRNLLLRALAGETINFTKLQIGNGTAQEPEKATALRNPIMTVSFSKIEIGTEYVTLAAAFNNGEVANGFHITEAGYFATDPDDNAKEILYALGNEDESTGDYVPDKTSRIVEMQLSSMIFIGDAENVTAAISSSLTYATKEDFDKHTADTANPHKVTAAQVGLDKVPNLALENQAPPFTEAAKIETIKSGETVATMLGKIRLAISSLIAHMTNRSNPHGVTAAQISAAAKAHTHDAQDINSGTLPIARGGTGSATAVEARQTLGAVTGKQYHATLNVEDWMSASYNGYMCYSIRVEIPGRIYAVVPHLEFYPPSSTERALWDKIFYYELYYSPFEEKSYVDLYADVHSKPTVDNIKIRLEAVVL